MLSFEASAAGALMARKSPAFGVGADFGRLLAHRGGCAGRHGSPDPSDWVHRYNDFGVDGLKSRPSSGRPPALTQAQMAELRDLVIKGPDPATDGVVRWRCVDLRAEVERRC